MLTDMCLPKFNIYQGAVAPNCCCPEKLLCPDFFQEKILSDVQSEIHLVRRNIVSTGQSVRP